MSDLTVWTDQGVVDVNAVSRWLAGEDIPLTDAERRIAYQACRDQHVRTISWFEDRSGVNMTRYSKQPDAVPVKGQIHLHRSTVLLNQKAG